MSDRYLMGLDIGSGHGACLLFNVYNGDITTTVREWSHPLAIGDGSWGVDLDTDLVWRSLKDTVQEAMFNASASPDQVLGIATASMRHGIVVLDNDGEVMLAIPTNDARAASETTELAAQRGEAFYKRTGHWPLPIFAATRLMWLQNHAPGTLHQAQSILGVSDWVAYRMTGTISMERSLAGETLLFDLQTNDWAWDLVESLNLPRRIFPRVIQAGDVLGNLTPSAAEYLGLVEGIPIVAGGADTQSGLLGCGVTAAGQLGVIAGTTTPVQLVLDKPTLDDKYRLWTGQHILPGRWVLESNVGQSGEALDWMAGFQYSEAKDPVPMLAAAATRSEPGALGITSTLGASLFNSREMGIPIGNITFSPLLANDDPERGRHIGRAVLEGLVYGVQTNIEQLLEVAGIDQPPIKLAGGIARSDLFAQILSNVSSTTVAVPATTEASALGAAMCAAVGAGVHDDLVIASSAMAKTERSFSPEAEHQATYQELFASWKELRDSRDKADLLAGDMALGALLDQTADITSLDDPHFRPRILVTAQISEDALDSLREIGDVEYQDYRRDMRLLSGEDLVEALNGFHVLVTEIDIVDAEALVELPDLRLVVSCRGNPVNVDIEACTKLGIPVLNTPGRNADAVADLTIAYMLLMARSLTSAIQFLRQEGIEAGDFGRMGMAYEEFQGRELWGKNIGLVGLGLIGRKVARRVLPFGAHILAYDPYISIDDAVLAGVELVSLDTLLAESDYVSLHAPVTSETRGLIGAAQLGRMKKGACLINTARAALLDENALYETLVSGHLGGAALDVFSVEPPGSEHPLLSLPNVIATPHIGGNTHEVAVHQGKIVKEDIERLIKGQPPAHVLNPVTLQNFSWTAARKPLSQGEVEALTKKPGPGVSDLEVETRSSSNAPQGTEKVETKISAPQSGRRSGLLSKVRDLMTAGEKDEHQMTQTTDSTQVTAIMEQILRAFLDFAIADQALQEFSNTKDFTMVFLLTDSKQEFYLRFDNGIVTGDLTQPGNAPDLTLKMKADILDGMFTGRINPTRAAMTGKIAFSGDTRRAMAMQKIQKDLSRCYSRAREQVGDPGDLTVLSADTTPIKVAAPPPSAAPSTPAALSTVGDERDEIIPVLNELYTAGLITSTGGNISLRTSQDSEQAWITPSQIFKGDLRANMMVRIDMAGEQLDDEALPASSERLVHCAVYRKRPDLNAIVHTHAPNTTILMLAGLPFVPISTEAAFVGEIPLVPFIMPGTNDLGDAVANAIGDGVAVFMQNHGLVVGGSSLRRAADVTEIIETTTEKLLLLHLLGVQPPPLPDDILGELSELRDLMA